MSNHGNSLLRRVRGKLLREVPVWGLSNPVTVEGDRSGYQIDSSDPSDALIAEGFVTAEVAMFNTDLRRRLWSGRLSELVGDREIVRGLRSPDLDVFVRIVGFRADAERSFRHLSEQAKLRLDLYTKGVNAWIDAGLWRKQACWTRASTRPRLWSPSDSLLLAQTNARMAACATRPVHVSAEAWTAGWTEESGRPIQRLWDLLRKLPHDHKGMPPSDDLRQHCILKPTGLLWSSRPGGPNSTEPVPSGVPGHLNSKGSEGANCAPGEAPVILPITVLPGGDNHRYVCSDKTSRRLRARHHDIEVRQSRPQRHWIRRNEQGGLISDLINRANYKLAPTGQAFLWSWNGTPSEASGVQDSADSPVELGLSSEPDPGPLARTRLVPAESGTW